MKSANALLLIAGLAGLSLASPALAARLDPSDERLIEDDLDQAPAERLREREDEERPSRRSRRRERRLRAEARPEPTPAPLVPAPPTIAAPAEPAPGSQENVVRETRFVYLKPDQDPKADKHERGLRLGGPRFGVSYVDGPPSKKLKDTVKDSSGQVSEIKPWLSQFGWQSEYRFFRTDGGTTALVEFIPLVSGLNQGLVLPSISMLFGLRTQPGWEFGAGPAFGLDGASYIVAAGYNFDLGGLNIPVNAAVGFGMERSSYTLSTGFNL